MLLIAVWIPVWMCAKRQGCEWNISVLKNSLKIGFELKSQDLMWSHVWTPENYPSGMLSCLQIFVVAVWIPNCVSVKYLSI